MITVFQKGSKKGVRLIGLMIGIAIIGILAAIAIPQSTSCRHRSVITPQPGLTRKTLIRLLRPLFNDSPETAVTLALLTQYGYNPTTVMSTLKCRKICDM